MQPVFTYFGRRRQVEKVAGVTIHWTNNGSPPPDVPFCGYSGEARHCQDTGKKIQENFSFTLPKKLNFTFSLPLPPPPEILPIWAIVLISLLVAALLSSISALFVLRKIRSESDLNSNWWNIDYNEIIFPNRGGGGGAKSSLSQLTATTDDPGLGTARTRSALTCRTMSAASLGLQSLVSAAGQFDSVLVGLYRGVKIAYKPLLVKRLTMSRKMLMEFRQVLTC